VQLPSGPPILSGNLFQGTRFSVSTRKCPGRLPYKAPGQTARSVAANALGLGPRERRCKSCRADHFQLLSRITVVRPPVKRGGPGANPAWAANLNAPVAQNTERRRPKARVAGESPAWSATEAEPAEPPERS
jgi:hypothetical protein